MKRNLFLILVALTFVGCVGHHRYTTAPELFDSEAAREGYRQSIRSCGTVAHAERDVDPRVDGLCDVAIIEFDDQGEFWQREQLDATLGLIHERSRPGQEALVILFVHGWQNDASPHNELRGNLASFNEVLLDIAAEQVERCDGGIERLCGRPVVGVYLAWRGDTFRTPLGKSISYFHRRATAERVARVSFSHALHRIVNHAKGIRSEGEDGMPVRGNRESVVLVVGHSLGALILENTILRSLTHETDDFRESFPVDMAVLVNSANDSVISRQFVDALQGAPPAPDAQGRWSLPLIVSVTSRGDWATRRLTPASQTLRRVGKAFRNYDDGRPIPRHSRQLFFFKRTAAHTGPGGGLLSHEISCPGVEGGCAGISGSKRLSLAELRGEEKPDRNLFDRPAIETTECHRQVERDDGLRCIERIWFPGQFGETLYEIRRLPEARNDSFYWVIQLPKRIVPDHSRIFQSEFVSLMSALVGLRQSTEVSGYQEARRILLPGRQEPERSDDRLAGGLDGVSAGPIDDSQD